jgi:hypothetical protein
VKIVQQTTTAINLKRQQDIKVMPNPVSEQQLTIFVPEDLKTSRATFMDLNGKVINVSILINGVNTLNVRFQKGMYLLNISGDAVNYTTKIIVN